MPAIHRGVFEAAGVMNRPADLKVGHQAHTLCNNGSAEPLSIGGSMIDIPSYATEPGTTPVVDTRLRLGNRRGSQRVHIKENSL